MPEKPLSPDQAQAKYVGDPPIEVVNGAPIAGEVLVAISGTQAEWAPPPPSTLASSVVSETAFGQASAVGVSAQAAREDHTHGTPADPIPTHDANTAAHPDKVTLSGSQTITGQKTHEDAIFNPTVAGAPFAIGANGDGQLVTGLNADLLDGQHASAFAQVTASAPTQIDAGDTADTGASVEAARADHQHALNTGLDADIQDVGYATTAGTSPKLARADHVHALALHPLLGVHHDDTVAAAPLRGALIVGDATPAWQRLALGGSATFLRSDGTDAAWSAIQPTDVPQATTDDRGAVELATDGEVAASLAVQANDSRLDGVATVATADATPTALLTLTVGADAAVLLEAHVAAKQASGVRAGYIVRALIYRTGAGAAAIEGLVQDPFARESDVNLNATIDVNGNDARVMVTGLAATSINWRVKYSAVQVS